MQSDSVPTFELTLANYFRERLQSLCESLDPTPHEDTLWYTGNMLARFGSSEQLFCYDQGHVTIRPLAMLYKDAHETSNPRERCLIMRQLGDCALFLGALFPERYEKRGILKDYFVGMGGGAYDYLSDNAHQNRHIFSELAASFTRMLEIIARACNKQSTYDSLGIINLYKRYQQTGNPRIAEQLETLGFPLFTNNHIH
jgi:hypothetical protein